MFSLIFLLLLNSISRAAPLPVRRPLINDDTFIALLIYSSVNITLEAQFGIKPIRLVINGLNILFLSSILDKIS